MVVFFDELQEVGGPHQPYGDPDRLTKRMRAIFQRTSGVSYLFAGSLEHLMRDFFTRSHGPPPVRRLPRPAPIDGEAWAEGLNERFEADGCEVEPAALDASSSTARASRGARSDRAKEPPRDGRTGDSPDRPGIVEQASWRRWPPTGSHTSRSSSESAVHIDLASSSRNALRAASPCIADSPGRGAARVGGTSRRQHHRKRRTRREAGFEPVLRRYLQTIGPFE